MPSDTAIGSGAPDCHTDLDMDLVSRIVRQAGIDCLLQSPDDRTTVILAEPRPRGGRTRFTVRATRIRADVHGGRDHVSVGPNDARRTAMHVPEPDERHLAALILAQALRVEPDEMVTVDEIRALGLTQPH
jgi:hypothetical protein